MPPKGLVDALIPLQDVAAFVCITRVQMEEQVFLQLSELMSVSKTVWRCPCTGVEFSETCVISQFVNVNKAPVPPKYNIFFFFK